MILREVRRFLRSGPVLGLSGVVVLALGMGTSGLALTLLLAFSALPYPGLRSIGYATIAEATEGGGSVPIAWQRLQELKTSASPGARLAAYSRPIHASVDDHPRGRPVSVAAVSRGFFSVFTPLTAGRDFSWAEEEQTGKHAVILSLSLADKMFRSPATALGQFIAIVGLPFAVVGVASSDFRGMFGDSVDAWVPGNCLVPLMVRAPSGQPAGPDVWKGIAAFYAVAASETDSSAKLASDLDRSLPLHAATAASLHVSQGLTADPVRDAKLRKWLRLGLLLALVFTIISSLNFCLLLLARTPRYIEEVRLKKALGAGRVRLVIELMIGPAAMVGAGLLAAYLVGASGLMLISRMSGFYWQLVRGSWEAALRGFGSQLPLACGLAVVVALIPALGLLKGHGMPTTGYASTAARRTAFLLQIPVTLQIAFCAMTWILTGMIVSALLSLMKTPLGYDPDQLNVVCIGPASGGTITFTSGSSRGPSPEVTVLTSLTEQLRSLPGVRSASYASNSPFDESPGTLSLQRSDTGDPRTVNSMTVSPDYFRTMGTSFIRGIGFSPAGVSEIVINELVAKELWPNENPVDRTVRLINPAFAGMPAFTVTAKVVGVVGDIRLSGYSESPQPTIFSSFRGPSFFDVTPRLLVRGRASVAALRAVSSREIAAQLPGLQVLDTYSAEDRARASLSKEKERAWFAFACALAMALVAAIGLYGALTYYVSTRRRDLAVRICFGASPQAIRSIILRRAAQCAVLAVVFSLPVWPVLKQLSSTDYLGRVSWSTPRAALTSLVCILAALLVSLMPALAAVRIAPSEVLKEQ